jgi:hypothetical protein
VSEGQPSQESTPSGIGDRESGIREVSGSRPRKCRFPDEEIPDRNNKALVITHRVSGIQRDKNS